MASTTALERARAAAVAPPLAAAETLTGAARGAGRVARAVIEVPAGLLAGLARVATNLDQIAAGVEAMEGEFVGMREDIRALDRRVVALHGEVGGLAEPIGGIGESTREIDARVERLGSNLASVEALAARLGRFGRGRARPGQTPPVQ